MISISKLGLLLTLIFALGSAGSSSAAQFHSGSSHTTIKGSQTTQNVFKLNMGTMTCGTVTFEGTQEAATAGQITLVPNYNGCSIFGFINVPIHENGCHYTATLGLGTMDLSCPSKPLEVTVPGCTVTIGTQTMGPVDFNSNVARTDFNMVATFAGWDYTQHDEGITCTGGFFEDGRYTGTTTLTGQNTVGSAVPVWHE